MAEPSNPHIQSHTIPVNRASQSALRSHLQTYQKTYDQIYVKGNNMLVSFIPVLDVDN